LRRFVIAFLLALPLLAQPVHYHFGDDLRWAAPNFDDSAWPVVEKDALPPPPKQGDGFVWVRQRRTAPAGDAALWLLLRRSGWLPNLREELRFDGRRIGSIGQLPPDPQIDCKVYEQVYDLQAGAVPREVLIARRIWVPPGLRGDSVSLPRIEIGSRDAIHLAALRGRIRSLRDTLMESLMAIVQAIGGIGLLIAWRRTRATSDVFWFALHLIFWNSQSTIQYLTAFVWPELSFRHFMTVVAALDGAIYVCVWCFTWAIFCVPVRWPLYLLAGTQVAFSLWRGYVTAATPQTMWLDHVTVYAWYGSLDLAAAFLVLALAWWLWPRSLEQRVIVVALLVLRFMIGLTELNWFSSNWLVFGFPISVIDSFQALLMLAMAWVLFRRVWHTWMERQALGAEFEAAREMQESLIQRLPDTPGFAVESAYRPASQVGGDFYRIFPADEGAVLVIVGDVSGKGLKAAMTVSGLVCAMEGIQTRRPGAFLEELNFAASRYMKSGFATCCVALIQRSGEAVIANAGHPSPYVDGLEVEIEAGLPLGIAQDVKHAESLARGEQFTFVSDGVVEAADAKAQLFGFERTRELSTRSAREIAEAAQAWGQNDDITVVTVRRTV
jgi:phosphoserine phosphatase RsbU/P